MKLDKILQIANIDLETISEATRYKRETGNNLEKSRRRMDFLEYQKKYFVHYGSIEKFGINPTNKFDTPTGFYAYPLDYNKISRFATDRENIFIFEPNNYDDMLIASKYTEFQYNEDVKKLIGLKYDLDLIKKATKNSWNKSPAGLIWNVTRELSGNVNKWNTLFRYLGYYGFIDDVGSIIHKNERYQAVFFDVTKLRIVDVVKQYSSSKNRVNLNDKNSIKKLSLKSIKKFLNKYKTDTHIVSFIMNHMKEEFLKYLINDNNIYVRVEVAKRIDPKYLPKMMNNSDARIKLHISKRIDPSYLPEMMYDETWAVRVEVAKRINPKYLPQMMDERNEEVMAIIIERIHPKYLTQIMDNINNYWLKKRTIQRMKKLGMI